MLSNNMIKNIFTIDTEEWFHANYENNLFLNDAQIKSTVEENTETLLQILENNNCKATFFILGFVAEQHAELVKKIADMGHEIASHGYGHQLVYKQTQGEFRDDIRKSKILLENIIGRPVIGYRAPSWSITKKSIWALEILTEEGYKYDSSIFPFENFLYGISGAPRFQYHSKLYNDKSNLIEIPPSTIHTPLVNIPFSGGFYFRAMPAFAIKSMAKVVNRQGNAVLFYLHPREIDPEQPRLNLKFRDALIHYWGINGCEKKLLKIVKEFNCTSIINYLNL